MAPFGVALNSQFFLPTVNGRMAFSLKLLEKLELLADCLTYLFAATFSTPGQVQVILSGIPAVHPWNVIIKSYAEVIDDSFQIFSCLIQKIYILRERDFLRGTGCIKNHCSTVLTGIFFICIQMASTTWCWIIWCVVCNDHLIDFTEQPLNTHPRFSGCS